MKTYQFDVDHMTKMAAMSIYSKKYSTLEPEGRFRRNLASSICDISLSLFVQMIILG